MAVDGTAALALPAGGQARADALGVFTRPRPKSGWRSWVTTVDHKKIGIMYGASALFFFLIGGVEALLIRLQLAMPNGKLLSADLYNQVFTMHGTTMIFLVVMPIGAAFMNYLLPLQIGARDVAFPRMNALSFWVFLFGGVVLNSSWLLGGGADGGAYHVSFGSEPDREIRPPFAGPAGRAGQDRPQGDRRGPVPARREPERAGAHAGRRGGGLRQRRRRGPEHRQRAAAQPEQAIKQQAHCARPAAPRRWRC